MARGTIAALATHLEETRLTHEPPESAIQTALDEEQRKILLLIASGAPSGSCLEALSDAVGRLAPGTRACVLLAGADRSKVGDAYSTHLPASFACPLRGLPIEQALFAAGGQPVAHDNPVGCADIEQSPIWAAPWRAICRDHGLRACHARPALTPDGTPVGWFFVCLTQARTPTPWEQRVAEFGALATSIVVERDRAAADLKNEVHALARLQALSAELVGPGEFEPLLKKILAAAADISGTEKGNIQIYDPAKRTLRIAVHQGLSARLVEHFAEDGWVASCAQAAQDLQRLVVPDVEQLTDLQGTQGLEIVLEDDIRSIQCTPLLSRSGQLLGMLNNHYRWPGGPSPEALRYIDLLARQAAELLERHLAESELARERRRKDEFLAVLAHELRNPLAALRNMLEVLKRAERDPAMTVRAREVMDRQLRQLVRLVDDLLDVNRINRGKLELRLDVLTLDTVLQHAIETCRPALEQHGHRLRLVQPDAQITLRGDAERLSQVFGNLLSNAAKYTPPGGDIEFFVEPGDDAVQIAIRDNGAGIPPDQLDRIFDMFTQVDRTLERAQGGLGIGLMLVKRLVEMHGGTVHAHSDGLGQGSEFVVRLPVTDIQHPAPQAQAADFSTVARRVLVVDDNRDAVESLAAVLALEGHEVNAAYDGEEAIAVGERIRPQVILMDIGMPGMGGHEACRRIRTLDWGKDATILALSGWGQEEDRRASLEAGFDAHLVKPVDMDVLLEVLSDAGRRDGKR
ncbi:GAF domain-containing protein [Achromobacter sp. MFA1 R4]|nr:GAF domain-containing protein [Achromobacter sp. MFA1 R4]